MTFQYSSMHRGGTMVYATARCAEKKVLHAVLNFSAHHSNTYGGNWPNRKQGILYCLCVGAALEISASAAPLCLGRMGPDYFTENSSSQPTTHVSIQHSKADIHLFSDKVFLYRLRITNTKCQDRSMIFPGKVKHGYYFRLFCTTAECIDRDLKAVFI